MKTPQRAGLPRWIAPVLAWGAIALGAIALGIYATPVRPPIAGRGPIFPRVPAPPPDLRALLSQLGVGSTVWFAMTAALPFLVVGARRLDPERLGRVRTAGISFLVVLGLAGATALIQYFIIYQGAPLRPGLLAYLSVTFGPVVVPWIALVGLVAVVEGRRRAFHSAVERERLRAELAEQRLIALTAQLHPHFLFNTLQGISTLIHRDPEAADAMLTKLSDLLRDLLRHRDRVSVPLKDELRYARTYLEIAELRFGDRLSFRIDVPPELEQISVPLFILQPLVENALRHGIGSRIQGGRVTIQARRVDDRVDLEVVDDGAGLPATGVSREGLGLGNTRERLAATFGADYRLALAAGPAGGAVARINFPFRPHPAMEPA